jgi:hypothetical protein
VVAAVVWWGGEGWQVERSLPPPLLAVLRSINWQTARDVLASRMDGSHEWLGLCCWDVPPQIAWGCAFHHHQQLFGQHCSAKHALHHLQIHTATEHRTFPGCMCPRPAIVLVNGVHLLQKIFWNRHWKYSSRSCDLSI